jgi:hypothetical protein
MNHNFRDVNAAYAAAKKMRVGHGSNLPHTINQKNDLNKSENTDNEISATKRRRFPVLNDSDWTAWKEKYLIKPIANGEYELMIDDRGNHIYEFPLFTTEFCEEVIELAEHVNKWTDDRHDSYPTNDVLLDNLQLQKIYQRVQKEIIFPLCSYIWQLGTGDEWSNLYCENFLARYTTDKQGHLSVHHDDSDISMIVKMNNDFEGGGTWFPKYNTLSNPDRIGTASIHPGRLTHRHGARPITSGKRYVIVSFMRRGDK